MAKHFGTNNYSIVGDNDETPFAATVGFFIFNWIVDGKAG